MGMRVKSWLGLAAVLVELAGFAEGFERTRFLNPAPQYSPAYFWMWKDQLDPQVLLSQLEDMKAHGLDAVCVHPFPTSFRPARFTSQMSPEYLSDAYLEVLRSVAARADELGMNFWFYDEGGWPSGSAAGQVAASDVKGEWTPLEIAASDAAPGYKIVRSPAYAPGRRGLPSILELGATERFLALTHEQVYARLKSSFGKSVRFTFTDEPEWVRHYHAKRLGWTRDFAEQFKVRKGYDILPFMGKILATYHGGGDAETLRHRVDYHEVIADLLVERYLLPLREWGRTHGVKSSGHFNGDDLPGAACRYGHGNLLKSLRALDAPGIDVIWRQLYPNYGPGNEGRQVPFPRYAKSAANQIGAREVLSESFGIYGSSVTPDEMKWLVDYQLVRGVSSFVFAYYSMNYSGQWMTLFEPQSGPTSPYWDFEAPFFRYVHRLSAILAEGEVATDIAVFFDARAFFAGGAEAAHAWCQQETAAKLLDQRHVDYDFVDDDPIIAAELREGALEIGPMRYRTIVVPSEKWMKSATRAKLAAFAAAGGRVIGLDGIASLQPLLEAEGVFAEHLRVTRRVKGEETLYFVVNESPWEQTATLRFATSGPLVRFDPVEGDFRQVPTSADGSLRVHFAGAGSAVFLVNTKIAAKPAERESDLESWPSERVVTLKDGWTLTPKWRYFAGSNRLECAAVLGGTRPIAELGDWRRELGWHWSGIATYSTTFDWQEAESEVYLDLGKVAWTCQVKLNGESLPARFFGPFRWRVRLRRGRNLLEVRVANNLATTLSDEATRDRIQREFYFPGVLNYESQQMHFDQFNHESGLIGPVRLLEGLDPSGRN